MGLVERQWQQRLRPIDSMCDRHWWQWRRVVWRHQ